MPPRKLRAVRRVRGARDADTHMRIGKTPPPFAAVVEEGQLTGGHLQLKKRLRLRRKLRAAGPAELWFLANSPDYPRPYV
jgi:hypothetical protein